MESRLERRNTGPADSARGLRNASAAAAATSPRAQGPIRSLQQISRPWSKPDNRAEGPQKAGSASSRDFTRQDRPYTQCACAADIHSLSSPSAQGLAGRHPPRTPRSMDRSSTPTRAQTAEALNTDGHRSGEGKPFTLDRARSRRAQPAQPAERLAPRLLTQHRIATRDSVHTAPSRAGPRQESSLPQGKRQ